MMEVTKRVRFTIIIPARNAAAFIGRALESLWAQTFRNFEVLVVDDGSDDETWAIAQGYQLEFHPEIHLAVFQTRRGVSSARNTGTEVASGEYILFLDADDTYEPTALATLEECIRNNSAPDILFSGYNRVAEDQSLIKQFSYRFPQHTGDQLVVDYLNKVSYTHLGALCFNHMFLSNNNLRFDCRFSFAEDVIFVAQAFLLAKSVCSTSVTIHNWTLRKGSTLYSPTMNKFGSLAAIASLIPFIESKNRLSSELTIAVSNHYTMLLLDTVSSLLWMGQSICSINKELNSHIDWSLVPSVKEQTDRTKYHIFFLRYFRLPYLVYCRLFYTPANFRKKGKNKHG